MKPEIAAVQMTRGQSKADPDPELPARPASWTPLHFLGRNEYMNSKEAALR